MAEIHVGVLGASSLVGQTLLPRLRAAGCRVTAFSRTAQSTQTMDLVWRRFGEVPAAADAADAGYMAHKEIRWWICVAPIWVLPDHFELLRRHGARHIVALSSTSRYTKHSSTDREEQATAQRLAQGEDRLDHWGREHGVTWTVLRPTLIYGQGQDRNIAEMARFIRRFGFFPVFGPAQGMRQPLHAQDVAAACVAALSSAVAVNRSYNLSGGDTLTYRDMAGRVFSAVGRPVRLLSVPMWAFRLALKIVRLLPRFRHWTPAMAERMSRDLVFDNSDAVRDLAWRPGAFVLRPEDVGSAS